MKRGYLKGSMIHHHSKMKEKGTNHFNCCDREGHMKSPCSCAGGIYFLGVIGAAIYYIQQATGFWSGVLGILKALVWPAFFVYKLLGN